MEILHDLLMILIGISGGVVVGTGMVALLTVLDIVPRLTQLTHSYAFIRAYEWALTMGATFFTLFDFFTNPTFIPGIHFLLILAGLGFGVFVGLLAAALTEVINVIPILAKRVRLEGEILLLLMAMALGKVIGSLLDWLFFYQPE